MTNLVTLDEKYPIERSRLMDVFDFSKYTPDEMLLLDVYLSKINPQDCGTKRIQFRKKEYELFLEKKRQQAKLFKDAAVGLYYKPFDPTYLPEDIGFKPKNIWKECSFEKNAETMEWVFTMECSDEALPFFFDTQKYGFIRYLVGYTKNFSSKHSFILYYYFKRKRQEEKKYGNPINPTVAELKKLTGTSRQKTYKEFKYFKRDVIERAINEINCFTDIEVTYQTIKKGRNIERLQFTVAEKVKPPLFGRKDAEPSKELKELFADELENNSFSELFENEFYYQMVENGSIVTKRLTKEYVATQPGEIYIFTKEQENEDAPAYFIPNKKINCDEINAYFQSLGSSPALPEDEVVDVVDTNEFNPAQEIDMSEILNEASPFEMEVMDELPEDVHDYTIENIRAIIHIAEEYISTEYTDFVDFESDNGLSNAQRIQEASEYAAAERQRLIVKAVKSYIIQDFNRRKKGINADKHIGYFQAGFRGWLEKRKEYENR
ncbi:MAG: replication initiation protein [Clostridia bacterium]|nr:replication initiation protein [Clostridia bacterium]MBR3575843.1 replication initiation protein [Clostridia bacterium]